MKTYQTTLCCALALGVAGLLGACDSGTGTSTDQANQGPGLFGQVRAVDGAPIEGARVRAAGSSATTDAQGEYSLSGSQGSTVVTVQADGFLPWIQQRTLAPQPTALQVQLLPRAPAQPLDSDTGGAVEGARGARVEVPGGALVDAQGSTVSGAVDVWLTPIDPSDSVQLQAAPGGLDSLNEQGQARKLESFGMMDITITQGDGELQVAPGQSLQIQIPAPANLEEAPDQLPLWSFDEEAGVWRQEGTLSWDAASQTYQGAIEHMSFWNADREQETTCVTGTVVDRDNQEPIVGAAVTTVGLDYNGFDGVTTDSQGRFVALVRTNSQVRITAYHDTEGSQSREISTGGQIAAQPASASDDACTDGGQWAIKRGEVTLPGDSGGGDGPAVCDPAALGDISGCLPTSKRLAECHNPQGACETNGNPLDLSYRFENGARITTDFDLENNRLVQTYYGPGDRYCGTQTISTTTNDITVELEDGTTGTYQGTITPDGGANYTCEDGSSLTLGPEVQAILQACNGGNTDSCEEGEGNTSGDPCESHAECGDQYCCVGVCTSRDLCFLPVCKGDGECEGDDICCDNGDYPSAVCQPYSACNAGACEQNSDCEGDDICCDGQCTDNGGEPYCEGYCRDHQDCQQDQGLDFCCPAVWQSSNYCTSDALGCYQDAACTQDSDCGGEDGLVCCDQDGALSCQSAQDCYGNTPCAQDGTCQGGLVCCDRFVADGGEPTCLTAEQCTEGSACTQDSQCNGAQICCARPDLADQSICLEEALCYLGQPCQDDQSCGGALRCCSFQGENLCLEECF